MNAEQTNLAALLDACEKQLAAEREKGVKVLAERSFELHECQQQLAAERDKHAFELAAEVEKAYDKGLQRNDVAISQPLREQLAAEREATNAEYMELSRRYALAVEALKAMPQIAYEAIIEGAGVTIDNLPNELQCIADAALAKTGDK